MRGSAYTRVAETQLREWDRSGIVRFRARGPYGAKIALRTDLDRALEAQFGTSIGVKMSRKLQLVAPTRAGARIAERKADYGLEDRFLPIDAVIQIAGIGRSMIYRKVRQGTFPKPYKPGGAATRWSEKEVRAWRAEVMAA